MPFIGRDWRSPGEAWVKTESLGWQRMKMIRSQLHPGCHQHNNVACSWPPPSQSGQHMANNCSGRNETLDDHKGKQDQLQDEVMSDELDSNCSSSCNSGSPSPVSSPEKQPAVAAPHQHLHPIVISSPYGRYSCCYHHHWRDRSQLQPPRPMSAYYCHETRQTIPRHIPRSLSRNSYETPDYNTSSSSISCSNVSQKVMRYNNSFSDLRSASSNLAHDRQVTVSRNNDNVMNIQKGSTIGRDLDSDKSPIGDNNTKAAQITNSPVILKKNGIKICDKSQNVGKNEGNLEGYHQAETSSTGQVICCCCTSQHYLNGQQGVQQSTSNTAPHCRVSVRTREVAMYNTISEAFYRLDFYNAIHDIRRFNYICKLLHLLITQNLTSLSGCATKVLFTMLEQVAWEVSSNKRNLHVIRNLLDELNETIQKYYCWGRPIGSSVLWQQHFDTIERISRIVDEIELSQLGQNDNDDNSSGGQDLNKVTFDKLPAEMIREILLRLNDYRDLVNSAQASPVMRSMINEQYIWQKLCRYHFTDHQLRMIFENSGYLNRVQRDSSLRGIKYARTISADGKISYRNPVPRKRLNSGGGRAKIGMQNISASSSSDSDSGSPLGHEKNSHVSKTIRIFDKGSTSATSIAGSGSENRKKSYDLTKSNGKPPLAGHSSKLGDSTKTTSRSEDRNRTASSNNNNQVDWELVFHHLRKKFDLREEYADCLLLCRHCRCLFWKSIGHPCIKGEDERPKIVVKSSASRQSGRPSVATLSRSFDTRARLDEDSENRNEPNSVAASSRPNNDRRNVQAGGPLGRSVAQNNQVSRNEERLAEQDPPRQQKQAKVLGREELVPKHITITPQAFLKFFSL